MFTQGVTKMNNQNKESSFTRDMKRRSPQEVTLTIDHKTGQPVHPFEPPHDKDPLVAALAGLFGGPLGALIYTRDFRTFLMPVGFFVLLGILLLPTGIFDVFLDLPADLLFSAAFSAYVVAKANRKR
jgi:hypothetical protein